jgi:hypothetical protein
VLSNALPDDCKVEVCDMNGMPAIVGTTMEVPPKVGDDCKLEKCGADGVVFQEDANENAMCAAAAGVCFNDSVCKTGTCTEQPKAMDTPAGDDGIPGNCMGNFCNGMGDIMPGPDNADKPPDMNMLDCIVPGCVSDTNLPMGTGCSEVANGKCCGDTCCGDTGVDYCVKNMTCCGSGKACAGNCCPDPGDNCLINNTCCSGSVCNNVCCPSDHACEQNTNICCPVDQQCPNGTKCCGTGQTCNSGNMCQGP